MVGWFEVMNISFVTDGTDKAKETMVDALARGVSNVRIIFYNC